MNSTCPVCSVAGTPILAIDRVPVACNVLWDTASSAQAADVGEMRLHSCPSCSHVWNAAFDAGLMAYAPGYENSLMFSGMFRSFAQALATDLVERHGLEGKALVGVGCGRGDFEQLMQQAGAGPAVGFDPSIDPTWAAEGVTVRAEYYGPDHADVAVDFLTCRHVLEHIDDPVEFLRTIGATMGTDTIGAYIEVPDAHFTLADGGVWDLIYEHCSYFTSASLRHAVTTAGLRVSREESQFGGQFRAIEFDAQTGETASVGSTGHEAERLHELATRFGGVYRSIVEDWTARLADWDGTGSTVVAWGAGSKGAMFLNTLDPDADRVASIVDISPRKRGSHVAGTGHRIVGPDDLAPGTADVIIVMNPNYRDEIAAMATKRGISAEVVTV